MSASPENPQASSSPAQTSAQSTPKTSTTKKLGLALISFALVLVLAEIGFRVRAHHENEQTLCRALQAPPKIAPNGQATLAGIIRLASDDRIAYELKPDMKDLVFKDGKLSTDSRGFRSPEIDGTRRANTVTIVGIGDSIMFGHGCNDGESYPDQLRVILQTEHPEIDWRVVNTGVPGYNTVMEVATLEQKCLSLQPDFVILGVTGNDYDPPVFVRDEDDVFDVRRSFLWEYVDARLGDKTKPRTPNGLTFLDVWAEQRATGERVPDRYSALFGKDAFLSALGHLKHMSAQHGFATVAFATIDSESAPEMMQAAQDAGLPTLRLQPIVEEHYLRTTGQPFDWDGYKTSDLVVSAKNLHPSALQHKLAAERLYAWMKEQGVLERLLREHGASSTGR